MLQPDDVKRLYDELLSQHAVKEDSDVLSHLKWQKASNDLSLAQGLFKISTDDELKGRLGYTRDTTFFDWVIVSSYYSIFHATQALLGMKRIKINDMLYNSLFS